MKFNILAVHLRCTLFASHLLTAILIDSPSGGFAHAMKNWLNGI